MDAREEILSHIHELDRAIPKAVERQAVLWRGAHQFVTSSLAGQVVEPPELVDARGEVEDLKDQLRVLHDNAALAGAELDTARAELRDRLKPLMREQLGAPLVTLIRGLEAAQAVERLCGQAPGQGQGRQGASALLAYLAEVRALLEKDN